MSLRCLPFFRSIVDCRLPSSSSSHVYQMTLKRGGQKMFHNRDDRVGIGWGPTKHPFSVFKLVIPGLFLFILVFFITKHLPNQVIPVTKRWKNFGNWPHRLNSTLIKSNLFRFETGLCSTPSLPSRKWKGLLGCTTINQRNLARTFLGPKRFFGQKLFRIQKGKQNKQLNNYKAKYTMRKPENSLLPMDGCWTLIKTIGEMSVWETSLDLISIRFFKRAGLFMFLQLNFTEINLNFCGIRTQIVRVGGKRADHSTTLTTAFSLLSFLNHRLGKYRFGKRIFGIGREQYLQKQRVCDFFVLKSFLFAFSHYHQMHRSTAR